MTRRPRIDVRRAALIAVTLAGVAPVPEAGAADELLVQNGTGMRLVDTANTPIGTAIPDARFGNWSRDGSRVIANANGGTNVVVMDADGSNRRVVATGWSDPVFSPDGRRWAGWRIASNAIQFGVGSVSGGPVTPIPNLSNLYMTVSGKLIAWSAQDEIAFAYYPDQSDGDTRAIGVIHPDGSGFRHLLTFPVPAKPQSDDVTYNLPNDLAFSPDGKTLAVPHEISKGRIGTRDDPFQFEYRITTLAVQPGGTATDRVVGTGLLPSGGSGVTQVTGVRPFGLSFAPDGNRMAATGDDGDHAKITVYAMDTGSLSPVAARTAVKARWRPTVTDTDGDGLLDGWEKNGIDSDGNGSIDLDLPAMGADFEHKDVFVELDYMPPHQLQQAAIDDVVTAFANSPVKNPDGIDGVTLHVDNGASSVMDPASGATWGALSGQDSIPHQNTLGTVAGTDYDWSDFDTTAKFADARKAAFHYAISAHAYDGTYSGISRDIGASNFLVTLGQGCANLRGSDCTLDAREQAGTFMHELGHNLGLRHGGDDDDSYKPSHLSVMNYTFQFLGLVRANGTTELDYSRHGFAMNEASLNEVTGFGFPAASPQGAYLTEVQCAGDNRRMAWAIATSKVDFNCDGTKAGVVSTDTNDDGKVSAWGAYAEWPTLIFKGGQVGDLGAQVLPDETVVEEADVAELLESKEVFDSYVPEDPDGGDPGGGAPGGGGDPGGGGPGPGGSAQAPGLSGLVIRPSGFRAAPRGGSIGRGGASVRYLLTGAATVSLKVEKLERGRRRGAKCVPPRRAPRGRSCTRAVPVRGSFRHTGQAGANSFTFTGRLGGRALRPGRYRLTATPVGPDGLAGAPKQARFRVLARR